MTRRATVRLAVDHPATVVAAVRPDDTDQMQTRVEGGAVVSDVERDDTGGLRSTVDDLLVNVTVAERTARLASRHDTNHE